MHPTHPRSRSVDSATWLIRFRNLLIAPLMLALLAPLMFVTPGAALSAPPTEPDRIDSDILVPLTAPIEVLGKASTSRGMSLTDLNAHIRHGGIYYDGYDGTGIDIALIDTGVSPVPGLDGDNVVHGPDLSDEGSDPNSAFLDTYGHGTHLAGILVGNRPGHEGIAPGARVVSVKVAGADGQTTVAQVVAAIDWVTENRAANGMNIRVLNLSLGQADVDEYIGNPLAAAVERAWASGITVVTAAGNRGATQGHLDLPARDPFVIAVGAVEKTGSWTPTLSTPIYVTDESNWIIPSWSAKGTAARSVDLYAPGRSIASYRVPGSTLDLAVPAARYGDDLFLGSGTSQAAAVVSAAVALFLDKVPSYDPDHMKKRITTGGDSLAHLTPGGMFVEVSQRPFIYRRGGYTPDPQMHRNALNSRDGLVPDTHTTWSGGTWSGATWSGATWSGATWSGGTWSGATWSGGTWSGATWSGATWSGATWSGATWSGATWSGATWSGGTWSGGTWSSAGWGPGSDSDQPAVDQPDPTPEPTATPTPTPTKTKGKK